jgi:gluconate 2-dehydrogenase alpha chain
MQDARTLPKTDAVVVGLGWTGSIAAKELVDAGLNVVALERGPGFRQDDAFSQKTMHDGLKYAVRQGLAHPLENDTLTFRNSGDQTALPMRRIGSFNPSTGYGGSGTTWSGHSFRPAPQDLRLRSHLTERYGREAIPDDMTIQDYGVTWEELEPHYARFERVAAISGTAGNVRGETRRGGNPFEGPRSADFPLPAFERHAAGAKFMEVAEGMGLHPFPVPVANASADFTNEYGIDMPSCRVCGHCPGHACIYGSKGAPTATIHPALFGNPSFEARPHAQVVGIEKASDGKTVTGVTYVDKAGRRLFQPADLVILSAYAFDNVRLLLLSEIGTPYDPRQGTGTLGRNYSYQMLGSVQAFFEDEFFSPQAAGGAMGTVIDDFGGDHFDHAGLGFFGGGFIGPFNLGAFPVTFHPTPSSAPAFGPGWKEAVAKWYQRTMALNIHCGVQSYRSN